MSTREESSSSLSQFQQPHTIGDGSNSSARAAPSAEEPILKRMRLTNSSQESAKDKQLEDSINILKSANWTLHLFQQSSSREQSNSDQTQGAEMPHPFLAPRPQSPQFWHWEVQRPLAQPTQQRPQIPSQQPGINSHDGPQFGNNFPLPNEPIQPDHSSDQILQQIRQKEKECPSRRTEYYQEQ